MNHTRNFKILVMFFAVVLYFGAVGLAGPVGTAWTYQGRLMDADEAANGLYDFQFKLFDADSDGNQIGGDVNKPEVGVSEGYFTVELDFGGVFDGDARWLEIGIRPGEQSDPCSYTFLSPRQKITAAPYALHSKTAEGGPGPGELRCFKQEAFSLPSGQWTTVCNLSDGPALVTNFWIATYSGGRTLPIRITFDGADPNYPHITGFTGELFSSGFDSTVHFRNNFVGVSRGEAGGFSGYLKLLMPYYHSIRVDVYGGGGDWFMLERKPITNAELKALGITPGMLLRTYGYGLDGQKTRYSELTLLETTGPTILAGLFQYNSSSYSNFYYLEGNYKIYYGGSGTASYESSGMEDFYHSSWYFLEGAFAVDDECMAAKTNYTTAVSRFFPLWRAPYSQDGLKFTWNVGQNGQGDPGDTVYTRWIAWYYK
jgi:hypothetical protein